MIVIALLLATLVVTFQRTVATRRRDGAVIDSVLIDGVTGLHLGWVVVAFAANVAAWLTAVGATPWAAHPTTWGAGALIVILIAGIVIGWASDWRVMPGLAICWGLFWLGIARLIQQPRDEVLGWIAVTVGTIVGVVPLLVVGLRRQPPVGDAASSKSG